MSEINFQAVRKKNDNDTKAIYDLSTFGQTLSSMVMCPGWL